MAVELATGYVSIIADTRQVPGQLGRAFGQGGQQAGQQGGEAAASGILGGLKGKAGMFGEVLGTAMALAGVSAGGLFVKSLQQGMEREKSLDMTQARLGVDDGTMQKIGFAAGRAYAGSFGDSVEANIDTARRAIQSGLLDPNATAQDTQAVISQLSGISDLMGEEIPAVSRAAGQAIKTGIAGSATEAFDLFAAAERNGLNVSQDFLDTIDEYGTQFRKLGLSGPEAVGLINQAVKGGARDVDTAADSIKEFSIRVVDGSATTTQAFQTLGFNADDLAARFAAGGATARTATSELLGEINKIEDPVKRNQIALALFGTKAEDLGQALNSFNVDSAAASLGKVAGAAQDAANTMGGNAATSIESAKRSIETSTDAIGSALAKAFGPELAKLADWVSTHQPEILDFLGKLVDAAFVTADAFLQFTSLTLRGFATWADGAGNAINSVVGPLGSIAAAIGHLTGNKDLENLGNGMRDLDDKFHTAADGARILADGIDNTARPGLDRLRDTVGTNIQQTQLASQVFQALGDKVTALPSGHDIILKDNTPEATARLEALGLKVTTLPDGTVRVSADTDQGQKLVDAFIQANTGRQIPLTGYVSFKQSVPVSALQALHDVPANATGGLFRGQGGPTSDSNLSWLSDNEYVVNAAATGKNLPLLDAINNGWTPPPELLHAMIPGYAGGGLVPGKAFAQSMDPAQYQMGGFSASAIDCSGMVSAVINEALGLDPFSSRMSTVSEGQWLASKGAVAGLGSPGDISVGWYDNGGGANGHTAMTLGDGTNVESNGSDGVVIGGPVGAAASMFTQKMHLPAGALRGGDLGGPATGGASGGGGAGSLGGGGASGAGSPGGAAGGAAGGTFGGVTVPAGVTPVWIVGGGSGNATGTTGTTPTSSDSFAPQAASPDASGVQTMDQVVSSIPGRAASAGQGFLDANINQFLGDIGARSSGGAIQELVKVIQSQMAAQVAAALQQSRTQAASFIGRR